MATDLFLEMAELPATGSLGTGQLDTRDLLVAGVPISISSKYLYLYLELSGSTLVVRSPGSVKALNQSTHNSLGHCRNVHSAVAGHGRMNFRQWPATAK